MYIGSKRYSRHGRVRYGSAVFIDDTNEDLVDTITARKKSSTLLLIAFVIILIKLISADFIGLIFSFIIFYCLYFATVQSIKISFTKYRLLKIIEYKHPIMVRFSGLVMVLVSIFSVIRSFTIDRSIDSQISLDMINYLIQKFSIPFIHLIYHNYYLFVTSNRILLTNLDASITSIIYLWFGIQYLNIKYEFQEIHFSHISEQLLSLNRDNKFISTSIFIISYSVLFIVVSNISFILIIFLIIIYRYLPRSTIANFTLFGSSGRKLINNVQILSNEFRRCCQTSSYIFNWVPQGNYSSRPFPYNIIPHEVASHYETGLRASLVYALRQGNIIGAIIAGLINSYVVIVLFDFAITYDPQSVGFVILFSVGLLIFSIFFWFLMNFISKHRIAFQREESLMIGRGFVGRYIEPVLWILKGNKLEGTRVQRGVSRRLIRYDKNRGFVISWRRITIYLLMSFVLIVIVFWASLGGLNLNNAIYIFPFLFDQSLEFLSNKANAELSFFIFGGFIVWGFILLNYPRFYARSRPQLFLEMQYPAHIPIILKDFDDHQDASLQFAKCLIESSRPERRKSNGRPGVFKIDIYVNEIKLQEKSMIGEKLYFKLGKSEQLSPLVELKSKKIIFDKKPIAIKKLRLSAETGYPRLLLKIFQNSTKNNHLLVFNSTFELKTKYENKINIITKTNIRLLLTVITKKSIH